MKLRLLVTDKCNRNCEGCCNKDWNLDTLPVCEDYTGYDLIMLTGGEIMLYPELVMRVINDIRQQDTKVPIILYTADVTYGHDAWQLLNAADGMTLTLHEQDDVEGFLHFSKRLHQLGYGMGSNFKYLQKSLRLNVFEGIKIMNEEALPLWSLWKVKWNMQWIKNCPLPKDEVFMRFGG